MSNHDSLNSVNIELLRRLDRSLPDPDIANRLFDDGPDAYLVVDQNDVIQLVNKQAELMFGYPRAQLYDQPLGLVIPELGRSSNERTLARYFREPLPVPLGFGRVLSGIDINKTKFNIEISISPILTCDGAYVAVTIRPSPFK